MTRELNLSDIQGLIIRAYGRFNFPFSRTYFFHFPDADAGRKFIFGLQNFITTAARWDGENKQHLDEVDEPLTARLRQEKPNVATNVAFTFRGLLALETPTETLKNFPEEFIKGMKARAFLLGDRDPTKAEEKTKKME